MKKQLLLFSLIVFCAACTSSSPHKDEIMGHWQVMVLSAGKKDMLCYAGSAPVSNSGSIGKREGSPYLMATRRLSGKIEISASAGYDFMPGSKVEIAIDDKAYELFFEKSVAWANDDAEDRAIIDALQNAEDDDTIEVRGVSKAGLTSIDTYSPNGFAMAVARIRELCP
jgi:hypothetical protein